MIWMISVWIDLKLNSMLNGRRIRMRLRRIQKADIDLKKKECIDCFEKSKRCWISEVPKEELSKGLRQHCP